VDLNLKVCQFLPFPGDSEKNSLRISDELHLESPDVIVFPEMFLTGYGADCSDLKEETEHAVERIEKMCQEFGKAAVFGGPSYDDEGIYNSLYFITPEKRFVYNKIHLAHFGVYSEEGFTAGDRPAMAEYRGVKFGLCICYDIFFPEVLRSCALAGSEVNICISASARQSKPFLERVLPARALENVSYTVFANNCGEMAGAVMYGGSRILDPFGETISSAGEEECSCEAVFSEMALSRFRNIRRHLQDLRRDVDWNDI
jgi:predicted amidohydrolase